MGGAEDVPQRSSSPLKRRASDLEAEGPSSQNEDVDMISVPPSDVADSTEPSTQASHTRRAQSIDMLRNEDVAEETETSSVEQDDGTALQRIPETDIPSIDEQIKTVTTICEAAGQRQPAEGDKMFLVSKRWLERVKSRGSEARKNSKLEPQGEIGPVDNSDITQQIIQDCYGDSFVQLKAGMSTDDFVLFPDDAWELVMDWYGLMQGMIPIVRFAHNTNPTGLANFQYEFHPPIFTVHRLWADNNNILIPQKLKVSNPVAPIFVFSRSTKYVDFLKKVKQQAEIDLVKRIRIWRVPRIQPAADTVAIVANTATPPSSRPGSPTAGVPIGPKMRQASDSWTHLLLDVPSFTVLERATQRELVEVPDHSSNLKYNGNMDLSMVGLGDDETIVLDEFLGQNSWVSHNTLRGVGTTSTAATRSATSFIQSNSQQNSGRNSPAPAGPVTRGRAQKVGRTLGTVGLSNLGNTCYMNSALQCVRSVEELTKYFLTGTAIEEINVDNPLGNNGDVAAAYARLLGEIYKDPVPPSVAPRNFKTTIGKYAPSFSGYGQQDSQEFLGFLLDGLQEDLSRVKKKPYIEKPDSTDEMVNNPTAIREMAAKVWDITKKRDDSVIADLFTGMYKSTLVCPVCSKVSITFDPFNNLTLQLPIENSWAHDVFYFPLNDRPIRITVDIDKQGSILSFKQFVSKRVGVPVERLFVAEEFKCKFYKTYDDYRVASDEIQNNDNVAIYELEDKPTNWPYRKAKKEKKKSTLSFGYNNDEDSNEDLPSWDDPIAERMVVPVIHRHPATERNRGFKAKAWQIDGAPHFIMLTREEARSEEAVQRKILEKVATFTTSTESFEDDDADASAAESVDPDLVVTTGSDADSSGDSKVVATSIDGEDELVDVTMKDTQSAIKPAADQNSTAPPRFNTRRPKFINPESYLNPSLQNMFQISYFKDAKEMIPSGWNVVDEDRAYPLISSRNPQLKQPLEDHSSNGYEAANGQEESENSDYDNFQDHGFQSSTRMNEESSDEDEDSAPPAIPRALPVRPAGPKSGVRVGHNKRRPRRIKTYSKKGIQPSRKLQDVDDDDDDQDAPDEGPLVRLGEGLVVDWNLMAWDSLFGGDGPDDTMRGVPTWTNSMPHLIDPELVARKAHRMQRRKNGITLDDCLDEFGKEEILSEMDTWYCPRCKEHRRASKKFELWKTPDILVMHLKRFSSSGMRRDKLDVHVEFPIEGLDLTSRVIETEEGRNEVYDLFAVDDHWGGLGGGHYTAYAKNFVDHEWYEYNDSSVSKQKDLSRIVSPSAYLLFYRRRSDTPLGGPRFKQIVHDFDNPREPSEDEASESGEDQGLVGNSSLRGSSSALTGVGAAHHQLNHGLDGVGTMTVNPSVLESLPAYESHEENNDVEQESVHDAFGNVMNDGLQASIEDEGIDVESGDLNYSNLGIAPSHQGILNTWNFSKLGQNARGDNMPSGTGSDDMDAASDLAAHDSSAGSESLQGRLDDFDNAVAEDFIDQSPVPDLDEDGIATSVALQADLLEGMNRGDNIYPRTSFEVTADDTERLEVEEPATEIHIDDNEEVKTMKF